MIPIQSISRTGTVLNFAQCPQPYRALWIIILWFHVHVGEGRVQDYIRQCIGISNVEIETYFCCHYTRSYNDH